MVNLFIIDHGYFLCMGIVIVNLVIVSPWHFCTDSDILLFLFPLTWIVIGTDCKSHWIKALAKRKWNISCN